MRSRGGSPCSEFFPPPSRAAAAPCQAARPGEDRRATSRETKFEPGGRQQEELPQETTSRPAAGEQQEREPKLDHDPETHRYDGRMIAAASLLTGSVHVAERS